MKNFIKFFRQRHYLFLSALALVANVTAQIGAGTASSWGNYQPTLPKELFR